MDNSTVNILGIVMSGKSLIGLIILGCAIVDVILVPILEKMEEDPKGR